MISIEGNVHRNPWSLDTIDVKRQRINPWTLPNKWTGYNGTLMNYASLLKSEIYHQSTLLSDSSVRAEIRRDVSQFFSIIYDKKLIEKKILAQILKNFSILLTARNLHRSEIQMIMCANCQNIIPKSTSRCIFYVFV